MGRLHPTEENRWETWRRSGLRQGTELRRLLAIEAPSVGDAGAVRREVPHAGTLRVQVPKGPIAGRRRSTGIVVLGCLALGSLALALPVTLAYDPWAWMVWGREMAHLDLDTIGGPSWKPLPVLVATPLSALGGVGPTAWLVLARAGGLLALVGAYRLAARFAGSFAGVLAAVFLALTPDDGPRFIRLVLEGHTAPFTAALAVWAVERHAAGRRDQAMILLTLLALDRPETWPFLGIYAVWHVRLEPHRRWLVVALLLSVPLFWFGGDWLGSGSPWHGANMAQVSADEPDRVGAAIERGALVVVRPVWFLALIGAALAWRRRERQIVAVSLVAVAWFALVVAMSAALGYAALARFFLPGAGLLSVSAGVALVSVVRTRRTRTARLAILAVAFAVSAPFVVERLDAIRPLASEIAGRGRADLDLAAVLDDAGGIARLRACPPLTIDSRDVPLPALAWRADLHLREIRRPSADQRGVVVATSGGPVDERLATSGAAPLARRGVWAVYAVGCTDGGEPEPYSR